MNEADDSCSIRDSFCGWPSRRQMIGGKCHSVKWFVGLIIAVAKTDRTGNSVMKHPPLQ
jgi:hypothetical protein